MHMHAVRFLSSWFRTVVLHGGVQWVAAQRCDEEVDGALLDRRAPRHSGQHVVPQQLRQRQAADGLRRRVRLGEVPDGALH